IKRTVRAVERICWRRHRLDADVVLSGWGENLGHRIAVGVLERNDPSPRLNLEASRRVDAVEAVVPGAIADRSVNRLDCLSRARRYAFGVQHEPATNWKGNRPFRPRGAWQPQVGVKAKRDRNRVFARGGDG